MRAWLGLRAAGIEFKTHDVHLYTKPGHRERIQAFSGAGQVPILIDGSLSIHQSLAILEWAAERAPEARLWPEDPALRARGRAISCEMLSGFHELRSNMPCNIRGRVEAPPPMGEALQGEIERIRDIFEASLQITTGRFLLGDFSIADCMYMPILARFRCYRVQLSPRLQAYSDAVFAHPIVEELCEIAGSADEIPLLDNFLVQS